MEPTLSFHTQNHPDGPDDDTVLFLHGGGVTSWMWQPVMGEMFPTYCIRVDLPGFGENAGAGPFSIKRAAERCAELLRREGSGGRGVVVGLSEGAQVAVQMLADAPDVVKGAFISSVLLLPMPGARMYSSRRLLGWMYDLSIPPFRNADWWIRLNMKYAAGIPAQFFPQFKRDFQHLTREGFIDTMMENQAFRLPAGLENCTARVVAICGKHEYPAMQSSARLLVETLPNALGFLLDLNPKYDHLTHRERAHLEQSRRIRRTKLGRFLAREWGGSRYLSAEHAWALTSPKVFVHALKWFIGRYSLPIQLRPLPATPQK